MKDMNDEELQDMIEKNLSGLNDGSSSTDDKDIMTYSLLFETLEKEPGIPLTDNFSTSVTAAIQAGKDRVSYIKLYVLLTVGFVVVALAASIYLNSVNSAPSSQLILLLAKYRWMLAFGVAAVLVVQILDKMLVENKSCLN